MTTTRIRKGKSTVSEQRAAKRDCACNNWVPCLLHYSQMPVIDQLIVLRRVGIPSSGHLFSREG